MKKPYIVKTFKYRCYPPKKAERRANAAMVIRKQIWNTALRQRNNSYAQSKRDPSVKPITSHMAQYGLIRKSDHPELAREDAQSMQYVLMELDAAFRSFWALNKKGDPEARPPQESSFWRHVTYRESGWRLDGRDLHLSNIGRFKLVLHRPIGGRIKTVTVYRDRDRWYACFACECPLKTRPKSRRSVKIEFDDWIFLRDNRGGQFEPADFYNRDIDTLARLNREKERKHRGSRNRAKARKTLAKWHRHIAGQREYYLHSIVDHYVKNYGRISLEDIPVKVQIQYAITNEKARKSCDAAYGMFIAMMEHKCREHQILLTRFKDEEKWHSKRTLAKEVAELEQAQRVRRKAQQVLRRQSPMLLRSLERDLKRAAI